MMYVFCFHQAFCSEHIQPDWKPTAGCRYTEDRSLYANVNSSSQIHNCRNSISGQSSTTLQSSSVWIMVTAAAHHSSPTASSCPTARAGNQNNSVSAPPGCSLLLEEQMNDGQEKMATYYSRCSVWQLACSHWYRVSVSYRTAQTLTHCRLSHGHMRVLRTTVETHTCLHDAHRHTGRAWSPAETNRTPRSEPPAPTRPLKALPFRACKNRAWWSETLRADVDPSSLSVFPSPAHSELFHTFRCRNLRLVQEMGASISASCNFSLFTFFPPKHFPQRNM